LRKAARRRIQGEVGAWGRRALGGGGGGIPVLTGGEKREAWTKGFCFRVQGGML